MASTFRLASISLISCSLIVLVVGIPVGQCLFLVGATNSIPPDISSRQPLPTSATMSSYDQQTYIVVILMENKNFSDIIGSASAPYTTRLANDFGLATNYFDTSNNFSLPNYLAIIAGSGYDSWSRCNQPPSQCPGFTPIVSPTVLDRIESAGLTWRAYMEGMPSDCYQFNSGNYTVRHNPFAYLARIINSQSECSKVVPAGLKASNLISDLSSTATASNFSWLTPDMCDDMHSCPIPTGDRYLSQIIPAILNSTIFRTKRAALFLTWDEGSPPGRLARIPAVLAGQSLKQNYASNVRYNHYSLLKTIETLWHLPSLTSDDDRASAMTEFFKGPQANANYTPNQPNVSQTITFQATANGGTSPYNYNWNFGDEETATGTTPTHEYETAGNYLVTLSITDSFNNTASTATTLRVSLPTNSPSSKTPPSEMPSPSSSTKNLPGVSSFATWLQEPTSIALIALSATLTFVTGTGIRKLRERNGSGKQPSG